MFEKLKQYLWKCLGRRFSHDEVINAEQDDALHDHDKVVKAMMEATERRREGNEVLKLSIQEAKRKTTSSFRDFEHLLRTDRERRHRRNNG